MCNCYIESNMCSPDVFGQCTCGQNSSTTSTTLTSYIPSTTTTSSTSTTTTTACEQNSFSITNNTSITNLFYQLINGNGTVVYQNYLLSSQTQTAQFPCCTAELKIDFTQINSIPFSTLVNVVQGSSHNYTFSNVTSFELGYDLLDCEDTAITLGNTTTTTTTSTSSTTTTIAPTTTTTTTTSTTTSSTSTTTTTAAPIAFIIRVKNTGALNVGVNTQGDSVLNNPPAPPTISTYYTPTASTLTPGNTSTVYNSTYHVGTDTRIFINNTSAIGAGIIVRVYFSDNNGLSYSLLDTFDLPVYTGVGPYPSHTGTYSTPAVHGVNNIVEIRVTPY